MDFKLFKTLFLSYICLYNSFIWCFSVLILLSWIDFSYSTSFFFVLSIDYMVSLINLFNYFYLASHLAKLSLAWFLNYFSFTWSKDTFSSFNFTYFSSKVMFYLSCSINVSFCLFSYSRPTILLYNCLVFSSWTFLVSSESYI